MPLLIDCNLRIEQFNLTRTAPETIGLNQETVFGPVSMSSLVMIDDQLNAVLPILLKINTLELGPPVISFSSAAMRWVYLIVIVLFALASILFCIQNLEVVTISFLGFSVRAPLAILTAITYVLGAATGGSLFEFLRRSVRASRASRPATS